MQKDTWYRLSSIFIVLVAFIDGILVAQHLQGKDEVEQVSAIILEDKFEQKTSSQNPEEALAETLDVPFLVQAPLGLWDDPWGTFAEEACAYMAYLWVNDLTLESREVTAQALLAIKDWEEENLETYKDTTLNQTLQILRSFYRLSAEISYEVTLETMMEHLDAGQILIIPVKNLENPYYGEPGPVHHTLLIYGYEESGFLVNDPGTVRGEAVVYDMQKILESIQDLNDEVRMIVLSR